MSPVGRAFLGAILGAILTLAIHPASRPFIIGSATRMQSNAVLAEVVLPSANLQPPNSLEDAGLWIQLGMERLQSERKLTDEEMESLISIADAAIERERQNAFWHQSKALLLQRLGRYREAEAAWKRAAAADLWQDYQTTRLQAAQQRVAQRMGASQSWQTALVYYARSSATAAEIERAARRFIGGLDYSSERGRSLRFATLLNGDLIRKGGRSIRTSLYGANMVEISAYPAERTGTVSPKRLWVGQNELLTALHQSRQEADAQRAASIFRENEGWLALVNLDEYEGNAQEMGRMSLLVAQAPVGVLLASLLGGAMWLLGTVLQDRLSARERFPTFAIVAAAVLLGAATLALSLNVVIGFATAACVGFLALSPRHRRSQDGNEAGPLFTFFMLSCAVLSTLALVANVIAHSGPAVALAPALGLPPEYFERSPLLALSILGISFIGVVAPLWAIFLRIGTPAMVLAGMRTMGAIMAVGGLMLAVALGPLMVYADRSVGETWSQLLANEPVYYLVQ